MGLTRGWPPPTSHPWGGTTALDPVSYKCGYCGEHVGSNRGYCSITPGQGPTFRAYICGYCNGVTMFDDGRRHWPQAAQGNAVSALPPTVEELYEEARACMSVHAYTAAVLACRKLLMNTAVSNGAAANESFVEYVDYLADNGYIPPDARPWVDHIRSKANEATHDI